MSFGYTYVTEIEKDQFTAEKVEKKTTCWFRGNKKSLDKSFKIVTSYCYNGKFKIWIVEKKS